jgi:hypothetical protein
VKHRRVFPFDASEAVYATSCQLHSRRVELAGFNRSSLKPPWYRERRQRHETLRSEEVPRGEVAREEVARGEVARGEVARGEVAREVAIRDSRIASINESPLRDHQSRAYDIVSIALVALNSPALMSQVESVMASILAAPIPPGWPTTCIVSRLRQEC